MVASFDDGSPEIPGGIVGRVERVLVIGAGIAGLTVANALAHAEVDCVVLEARDRIGGRLYTADLGGCGVDLGGSWIHQPEGNPLHRFARQVGIECRAGNPLPSLAAFDCATGRWLSPADIEEGLIGVEERIQRVPPRVAYSAWTGRLGRRGDRGVSGHDRAHRRRSPTSPASTARLCRSGCRRRRRGPVADVAVDAGGVRRRLLRGPARGRLCLGRGRDGGGARCAPGVAGRRSGVGRRQGHGHVGVRGDRGRLTRRRHRPLGCAQEQPAGLRATPSAGASRGRRPTRLRPIREGCVQVRRAVLA